MPYLLSEKHSLQLAKAGIPVPPHIITVSSVDQQMNLYFNTLLQQSYPISTARNGIGNKSGSLQTPPGLHRIKEKIGTSAPARTIFVDRIDTKEICDTDDCGPNRILSRILRLEGLEEGLNHGDGIDSWQRYIYIHGTNREDLVGTPISHGCICMKNADIISLFDSIREGTLVIID